jgi:anti-sigma factor RsiW
MTHPEFERQLDAYVDGELAPREARELEAHLAACDACAQLHRVRVALGTAIRAQIPALRAPDGLEMRVRTSLRAAAQHPGPRRVMPTGATRWLALAASLAVVAVGGWRLGLSHAGAEALAGQVLASHVRSLMPGHLTDMISSDQHTVKPWFNGKLDFSPPVYDFAGRGFPLIGGRLDYVGGRPVAALVYGRRQHLINVFLWPAARGAGGGPAAVNQQGYHLLHWTTPEYSYWVASDVGVAELHEFAGLLARGDSTATAPPR